MYYFREQLLLQKKPELKSSVSDEEVYMSSSESLVELYKHSSHPSEENINKRVTLYYYTKIIKYLINIVKIFKTVEPFELKLQL